MFDLTFKITKELINELLIGCRNAYPNEFFALLSSDSKNIIDSYVVVPILYQNSNSVSYRTDLLPLGFKVFGTIHSHPSGSNMPSYADLNSFGKQGSIHMIIKYPFRLEDVAYYDINGNSLNVELLETFK
jgi:proteasome lid subunit RPN8/RPN11